MRSLTSLVANHFGITSLVGLEEAINLITLEVVGNAITDLTPVASLPNLTNLVLADACDLDADGVISLADALRALRAVSTNDSAHSSSGYYMTTGRPHAPTGVENAKPGAPNDWPSLGALVKRLRPGGALPAAITVPEKLANDGNLTWPGQDAGFLGRAADPWVLQCDPGAYDFKIPELGLPADVPPPRFDRRRALLEQVNGRLDRLDRGEHDYFLGAMVFNMAFAEGIFAAGLLAVIYWTYPAPPWAAIYVGGIAAMILAPIALYPVSKLCWLAFDLLFRPPQPGDFAAPPPADARGR